MEEFAGFLQGRIVDRPVVDQTSLPDRYDLTLKWTRHPICLLRFSSSSG